MRKLVISILAGACALGAPGRSARADCDLQIPYPPDPVPPGFDWTPLAQDFCNQLASCGYTDPSCVSNYLFQVGSFPAPPGSGSEGTDTESASDQLVCEDSEEYHAGQTTCCAASCTGKSCGADDGCGQPCCLSCTDCAPVSCGVCQVADACGTSCSPAPDGTTCGFGSGGGFCQAGTCMTGPGFDAGVTVSDAVMTGSGT